MLRVLGISNGSQWFEWSCNRHGEILYIGLCCSRKSVQNALNNLDAIVTYMRTGKALLLTHIALCLLRGKAHTASRP